MSTAALRSAVEYCAAVKGFDPQNTIVGLTFDPSGTLTIAGQGQGAHVHRVVACDPYDARPAFFLGVSAAELRTAVKTAPGDTTTIALEPADNGGVRIDMRSGRWRIRIATHNPDTTNQLVPRPVPEPGPPADADAHALLCAIRRVAFSASHDEARPNLCGVCVTGGGVVSTDGHRLTYATCERTGVRDGARNVIVSVESIPHFPAGEAHSVAFTDKHLFVEFESGRACLSLVDGVFPDFRAVMPSLADMANMPTVVAERQLLLGVVSRVGRGASAKTKNVRLQFDGEAGGEATILASSACPDRGIEQEETLGVTMLRSNGTAKVGFNFDYVCDALKCLDCDNATLHYRDALSPAVLTDNDAVWCVVMPMRL